MQGVFNMKNIRNVKLSMNQEAEVVVTADVDMDSKDDKDDVYFVMFNILHEPLRFVVATLGNFTQFLKEKGVAQSRINHWLDENPEDFLKEVVKYQLELLPRSKERVRVNLDSKKNSDLSRGVVSSMLSKGYFIHISTYHYDDDPEPQVKIQKVPTAELAGDLGQMLEIIKDWDNFDYGEWLKEKGVIPNE